MKEPRKNTDSQEQNNLRIRAEFALKKDWDDPKKRHNRGLELGPEVWRNQRDLAEQLEAFVMELRLSIQKMIQE